MSRDRAVPVLLGLLLLLALPSAGLAGVGPSTPHAFLTCALLLTGFFALVAGGGRPLVLFVAALPFIAYGVLETPALAGTRPVPAVAFWVVVIVALVAPGLGRRLGGAVVAALLTLLAGGALLGVLPTSLTVLVGGSEEQILAARAEDPERVGAKRGAPVAVEDTPLGSGRGPFFVEATRGHHPVDERLYLVFGAGGSLEGQGQGSGTFLPGSGVGELGSAVELDVYDGAIVMPGAWPAENGRSQRIAEALAIYARRGGGPGGARTGTQLAGATAGKLFSLPPTLQRVDQGSQDGGHHQAVRQVRGASAGQQYRLPARVDELRLCSGPRPGVRGCGSARRRVLHVLRRLRVLLEGVAGRLASPT